MAGHLRDNEVNNGDAQPGRKEMLQAAARVHKPRLKQVHPHGVKVELQNFWVKSQMAYMHA